MALSNLRSALPEVRRFEPAITACEDAADIFREIGDRYGQANALNNLGLALKQMRQFQEAITTCQDVAEIFRDTGDRTAKAWL